jgi:hypothetical protein
MIMQIKIIVIDLLFSHLLICEHIFFFGFFNDSTFPFKQRSGGLERVYEVVISAIWITCHLDTTKFKNIYIYITKPSGKPAHVVLHQTKPEASSSDQHACQLHQYCTLRSLATVEITKFHYLIKYQKILQLSVDEVIIDD